MVRNFLLALALLANPSVLAALCTGQDYLETLSVGDRAQIDVVVANTPYAQGLLWQATRDDDSLILIGTMHIYDPRLDPIHARVESLIVGADLLLVEAGPLEEAQMQSALTTDPDLVFITDGPTLPEMLDDATWQALAQAVRDRSIPPFLAAKMQPWYLALTLAIPACAMPDLAAGARGLDHMLMSSAAAAGVPIKALEPWDTLFEIMRKDTQEEQIEALKLGLLPTAHQSAMFVAMLNSYFAGNIAEIWEASRIAARDIPGLDPARADALFLETEQYVLIDRNIAWIDDIEAAATSNSRIVIAVGAAHLPGEHGVLRLLEAKGWTIRQID